MQTAVDRNFRSAYRITAILVTLVVGLRAWLVPFAHDEVATFYFYIQPGSFWPFLSHPDANGHFLTSALGWLCFKLFGSSPFALRIPSLAAFLVLCYAIWRLQSLLSSIHARAVLISAFLLSFNFIGFYSLCRGYGLSMAFLLMALYYLIAYKNEAQNRHFVKFILFSQLALSANLTLIFVLATATAFVMLLQWQRRLLLHIPNITLLLLHFLLLYFWVRYAFFLQDQGALYYGGGESYWDVTFVSLINTVLFRHWLMNLAVLSVFLLMVLQWVRLLVKGRLQFLLSDNFGLSFFILLLLIFAFYLLKQLLGVNYPEDRTGIFFYVFFILSLAFVMEHLNRKFQLVFYIFPFFFVSHFLANVNFKVHGWRVYETFPRAFYERLVDEQRKTDRLITIGGHRVREFIYGFFNYNSEQKLSHMTAPEALQMHSDYAVAYRQDEPYYSRYYEELDRDEYWGFTLIRRKQPAERHLLAEGPPAEMAGAQEYYNLMELTDTSFNAVNPLLVEAVMDVDQVPVPFNAWLVLQVDAANGTEESVFVRTPLNLVRYNWNGVSGHRIGILSGNIPRGIRRLVVYIWNINSEPIRLKVKDVRLYQLTGPGVTEISKAKI